MGLTIFKAEVYPPGFARGRKKETKDKWPKLNCYDNNNYLVLLQ